MFTSDQYQTKILLHKPHPRKELLEYQVKQLIEQLEKAEALSMEEYKRLASEVSALLKQCKDEISGMITSPDSL